MTEKCLLDIEGIAGKTAFRVIDLPASEPWDFDGMIGWPPFKGNVLRIYASSGVLTFPHEVEEQLPGWTRVSIATNSDTLNLEISYAKGSRGLILIDTGNDMGVMLPPRKWQAWKKAHPHCPMTLRAIFRPADGYIAQEESWASNFGLGPLVITDVPVAEDAPSVESVFGAEYEGTFGLSALKRLDLIVDGKRGVAHLRTKTTAAGPYQHNRAGVAFLPSRGTSEVLVAARVLEGSPAWEAGVRSGDILLKCDGKAVSPLSPGEKGRLEGTPGTKLVLTLKRGRKTFDTMVTLRQMLPSAY
jgi:hypothetical protein